MTDEFSFSPPAFKPGEALVGIRRTVRDWRTLTERGPGFDLKGQSVLTLEVVEAVVRARVVRQPGRSPEWETHELSSSQDVRKFTDHLKKRVQQWGDRDE